jgi:Na+/glutamate symporter
MNNKTTGNQNINNNVKNKEMIDQEQKHQKASAFTRIFAIIGLIVIIGMYVLSLVASLSDWENAFGIFTGALAATIFVPIVIYLIRLFSHRES